jgi:hypothetical protein
VPDQDAGFGLLEPPALGLFTSLVAPQAAVAVGAAVRLVRLALALGIPGSDEMWRHMSWALIQLGVAFQVADDASELAESR